MTLDDDREQVRREFARFADKEIAPGAESRDQTGAFPYDLVPKLARAGIFGLPFPEEVGGQGADTVTFALALMEIARADQSVAALVANQVGLSGMPIYLFGSDEQRARWLPGLFDGTVIGAFGLTEPGGGSDNASMRTTAARVDGGWVINGSKTFITNAGTDLTGFITIAAVTGRRPDGRPEVTTFVVERDVPGLTVGPPMHKMGWRASDTRPVYLSDCHVPDSSVLGAVGHGLRQFLATLAFGRIQIAALGVGLVEAALVAGVSYAKQRVAFGNPIGVYEGISFKLADMAVDAEASRLLTLAAAQRRDRGEEYADRAGMAKLFSSEAAMRSAHQCVQIHGGSGFLDASVPSRLFRDAKILEIGEGTSEIQRLLLGRQLTGLR